MIEITKKSNKHLHVACSSKFEYLDPIVDESEAFVASHIEDPEFAYKNCASGVRGCDQCDRTWQRGR